MPNGAARRLSRRDKPFLVAEIGLNHNKDIALAKKLILEAKKAGADAVKLQSYTTRKFIKKDMPQMGDLFNIFQKYELNEREHTELISFSNKNGILIFSTPLTSDWVEYWNELDVFAFKVASGDLDNRVLLEEIIAAKKPIFLSTGASKFHEIEQTLDLLKKYSHRNLVLLHCVSLYPTELSQSNLLRMKKFEDKFNVLTGFSDHTLDFLASAYASLLGGCVIEKHFTLDKNLPGPDHSLSATPKELRELRRQIDTAFAIRDSFQEDCWEKELENNYFGKRSLYEINGELIPMRPRR